MPEFFVELQWVCAACEGDNRGRDKTCQHCNKPRQEERFVDPLPQPTLHDAVIDAEVVRVAAGGPDWRCVFCGSRDRNPNRTCAQCGGAKPRAASVPASPPSLLVSPPPVPPVLEPKQATLSIPLVLAPIVALLGVLVIPIWLARDGGRGTGAFVASGLGGVLGAFVLFLVGTTELGVIRYRVRARPGGPTIGIPVGKVVVVAGALIVIGVVAWVCRVANSGWLVSILSGCVPAAVIAAFLNKVLGDWTHRIRAPLWTRTRIAVLTALAIASGVAAYAVLRTRVVKATVVARSWTHAVEVERYQIVAREGFKPPDDAIDVRSIGERVHHREKKQVGYDTESFDESERCGETCTTSAITCVDQANGFKKCTGGDRTCTPKYCTVTRTRRIPRYENMEVERRYYEWKAWAWTYQRTVTTQGEDLPAAWPTDETIALGRGLVAPQQERATRRATYRVVFEDDEGVRHAYAPGTLTEYSQLAKGTRKTLEFGVGRTTTIGD